MLVSLIGAAAGGLTAAAATYASARMQQQPNDELRRGIIAGDISHDSGELQRAVLAARQADFSRRGLRSTRHRSAPRLKA